MESLYKGKWTEMVNDGGWEYLRRIKGAAAVIIPAMTIEGQYIFVEQYRKPAYGNCIEWAAGLIGDEDINESVVSAAERELMEETGFESTIDTQFVDISFVASPGALEEKIYFVLCPLCKKVGNGGGIDDENITVHIIEKNEVVEWLEEQAHEGKIIDSKIFSGMQLLEIYC